MFSWGGIDGGRGEPENNNGGGACLFFVGSELARAVVRARASSLTYKNPGQKSAPMGWLHLGGSVGDGQENLSLKLSGRDGQDNLVFAHNFYRLEADDIPSAGRELGPGAGRQVDRRIGAAAAGFSTPALG